MDREKLVAAFKALSDPRRLAIVEMLADGELCVCDLVSRLELSQPLVSHHLRELKRAGLVLDRRRGVWSFNRLDPEALARFKETLDALFERGIASAGRADGCCGRGEAGGE